MQQEFTLLLIQIRFDLGLNIIFKLKHLHFTGEVLQKKDPSFLQVIRLQQFLFLLDINIRIGTNEVDQKGCVFDILDGKGSFLWYVWR